MIRSAVVTTPVCVCASKSQDLLKKRLGASGNRRPFSMFDLFKRMVIETDFQKVSADLALESSLDPLRIVSYKNERIGCSQHVSFYELDAHPVPPETLRSKK